MKPVDDASNINIGKLLCPICGEPLQASEGCFSCVCGYSKCD